MMQMHEYHVLERRLEMTMIDCCSLERCLSSGKYGEKKSGLNGDSNPDPWDAGAVLSQLSYQSNWELVVMWVDYKPGDDVYRSA